MSLAQIKGNWLPLNLPETIENLIPSLLEVSITIAGFLVTILTVVVTIKLTYGLTKSEKAKSDIPESVIQKFFESKVYDKSINIIQNSIYESLFVFIGLVVVYFKFFPVDDSFYVLALLCCIGSLSLTVGRCLFVIHKIIRFPLELE